MVEGRLRELKKGKPSLGENAIYGLREVIPGEKDLDVGWGFRGRLRGHGPVPGSPGRWAHRPRRVSWEEGGGEDPHCHSRLRRGSDLHREAGTRLCSQRDVRGRAPGAL